jgi:signal transduction histidine kinase
MTEYRNPSTATRVLVVDDEKDFLESLAQRLKLRGLDVRTATNGLAALAALDEEVADVVVLDVRMPEMDGIETLRRIKESHPRVEVVMLTGHADLNSALEGMRFGFFDYLTKPVEISELVDKIQEAGRRRRGEEIAAGETFGGKLREHMIMADRLASLGELSASIAHEVNNPLAIIAESSGWLQDRFARDPEIPSSLAEAATLALGKIDRAVERARRISQNLLRFARAPDAFLSEVVLADLGAEVIDLTSARAHEKGVHVDLDGSTDFDAACTTDEYQLRQVLLNIVTNAIQAVEPGGNVVLTVESTNDGVVFSVIDDGPGIPEENIERIFEPFFSTKPADHGTGLGLSVCRGITERLGGRIEVENRLGSGCTFRIVLPLDCPDCG